MESESVCGKSVLEGRKGFRGPELGAQSLSLSTSLVSWGHHRTSIYILFCLSLPFFTFLTVTPRAELIWAVQPCKHLQDEVVIGSQLLACRNLAVERLLDLVSFLLGSW